MRTSIKNSLYLLLGLMGFKALPAHAAVDMFLCFDAGDPIKGESLDKERKDCIDVLAWSWGASQSGTTHAGAGGGAGRANFQDISITKYVDNASVDLLSYLTRGENVSGFSLYVRKASGCSGCATDDYIRIKASESGLVTSYSTGGSGGEDRLTENITLNFSRFDYCYKKQKQDGSYEAEKCFKWDIAANQEIN